MPRNAERPLTKRHEVVDQETFRYTTPDISVSSRPVDAYVQPKQNELKGVIEAFKALNSGLSAYVDYKDVKNKQDLEQGGLDQQAGRPMVSGASLAYIRGYETLAGQAAVAEHRAEVVKYLNESSNLSPDEFKSGLDDLLKKRIAGMSDNHLKGFLPGASDIEEKALGIYQEKLQKQIRENTRTNRRTVLGDQIKTVLEENKASTPNFNTGYSGELTTQKIGAASVTGQPSLVSALQKADADMFAATGKHLNITSSYRTVEKQAELYAKLKPIGAAVAEPGKSRHNYGLAVDISNHEEAKPFLEKYGLSNPIEGDKVHFQFAGGFNLGSMQGMSRTYAGQYAGIAEQKAEQYMPGDESFKVLVNRMIRHESGGDSGATSPKGAMGVMQLMPATAKDMGVNDPYNPEQNVDGGVRYAAQLYQQFGRNPMLTLIAYNAGPEVAKAYANGGPIPDETRSYIAKVLGQQGPSRPGVGSPLPPLVSIPKVNTSELTTRLQKLYKQTRDQGKTMGHTDEEIQEDFVETLSQIAEQEKMPELFQVVFMNDPSNSGFALVRSATPGIQEKILNGLRRAEAAREHEQSRAEHDWKLQQQYMATEAARGAMAIYTDQNATPEQKGAAMKEYVNRNVQYLDPGTAESLYKLGESMAGGTFATANNKEALMSILKTVNDPQVSAAEKLQAVSDAANGGKLTESITVQLMNRLGSETTKEESLDLTTAKLQQTDMWRATETGIRASFANVGMPGSTSPEGEMAVAQASSVFFDEIRTFRKDKTKNPEGREPNAKELLEFQKTALASVGMSPTQFKAPAGPTVAGANAPQNIGGRPATEKQLEMDKQLQTVAQQNVAQKTPASEGPKSQASLAQLEWMAPIDAPNLQPLKDAAGKLMEGVEWFMRPVTAVTTGVTMGSFKTYAREPEKWNKMNFGEQVVTALKDAGSSFWATFTGNHKEAGTTQDVWKGLTGKTLEEHLGPSMGWAAPLGNFITAFVMDPTVSAASATAIIKSVGTRQFAHQMAAATKETQAWEAFDRIQDVINDRMTTEQIEQFRGVLKTMHDEAVKSGAKYIDKYNEVMPLQEGVERGLSQLDYMEAKRQFTMRPPNVTDLDLPKALPAPAEKPALPAPGGMGAPALPEPQKALPGPQKLLPPPSKQFILVDGITHDAIMRLKTPALPSPEGMGAPQLEYSQGFTMGRDTTPPNFILLDNEIAEAFAKAKSEFKLFPVREDMKLLPEYIPDFIIYDLDVDSFMSRWSPEFAQQVQGMREALGLPAPVAKVRKIVRKGGKNDPTVNPPKPTAPPSSPKSPGSPSGETPKKTEAPKKEEVPQAPKVSRPNVLKSSGKYNVKLSSGDTVQIFRVPDPGSPSGGTWYVKDPNGANGRSPLGPTKSVALSKIEGVLKRSTEKKLEAPPVKKPEAPPVKKPEAPPVKKPEAPPPTPTEPKMTKTKAREEVLSFIKMYEKMGNLTEEAYSFLIKNTGLNRQEIHNILGEEIRKNVEK